MLDVAIIGGGPAGSGLACYLRAAKLDVAIFESAHHPRPHVGESLVPSTTRIFREIGFLPEMEKAGFVHKYGAAWHPTKRHGTLEIRFNEYPQPGIDQEYTYHVDRAKFDMLLLKHAESKGAKVSQGVKVTEVLFEGTRACGVRVEVAGQSVDIPARMVVDASGRNCVLGRQLKIKEADSQFNQFAVHAWFENVDRGPEHNAEDIHIHFLPVERGWVWQIPITDKVTSIGVVAEKSHFKQSKGDYEGWFQSLAGSAPDIANAMMSANRVTDFRVEADYSYCMNHFCGDGYALIGDAARFVDPIFSSGVSVALYSGKFASEVIIPALANNNVTREALLPYEARLKRGTKIWYEFITLYYKLLPSFTKFIAEKQYRLQVLQLLQGDVYDRDTAPVLDAMREYIKTVESVDGHFFAKYIDPNVTIAPPVENVHMPTHVSMAGEPPAQHTMPTPPDKSGKPKGKRVSE